VIIAEPREIRAWFRVKGKFNPPSDATFLASVTPDRKITGALAFHGYEKPNVEISAAAHAIPRALLRAAYRYVTVQLGCTRATFRTRADNVPAHAAMRRLNARVEGELDRFYPDGCKQIIYGLMKEDFPFNG